MKTVSVPGKIFLLGEYSVIEGGVALIAPVRPPYQYSVGESAPHPESPYGAYLTEFSQEILDRVKARSFGPGPGFGSSTAELIAGAQFHLGSAFEPSRLLSWYLDRFPKASGGDLLVQAVACESSGLLYRYSDRSEARAFQPSDAVLSRIQVFSVDEGRKLRTHEDLKRNRPILDRKKIDTWVGRFRDSLRGEDESGFGVLNEFADELNTQGLETEFAHRVRVKLRVCPGVISAKGCGAGLNDVFLVALGASAGPDEVREVDRMARKEGLKACGTLREILW